MVFIDKMCYEVANSIITNAFWLKYEPNINEYNTWYSSLNRFIVMEWESIQGSTERQTHYTKDEENMIINDAINILIVKLKIDKETFKTYKKCIDCVKLNDILRHYCCNM